MVAVFNARHALALAFDQLFLHVWHSFDRAAYFINFSEFCERLLAQLIRFRFHDMAAVKEILIFEQVCLISEDLLHAQRPLLVEWTRQTHGFVPGRQLQGPAARTF